MNKIDRKVHDFLEIVREASTQQNPVTSDQSELVQVKQEVRGRGTLTEKQIASAESVGVTNKNKN